MDNIVYLFFGISGCEYVLNPLYKHMKELGYNCIEIQIGNTENWYESINELKGKRVVLITSAHLFFDNTNFEHLYFKELMISVLELIDLLRPIKKVYYPHDLTNPILDYEQSFISLFDVFLSPLPYCDYLKRYTRVVEVGWIKKNKMINAKIIRDNIKIVHAFSNFDYFMKKGHEYTYNYWKSIYKLGVRVKLPAWNGSDEFEKYLGNKKVYIEPANSNIYNLIETSDIIINNGDSSINLEASLSGCKVINVIDGTEPRYLLERHLYGVPLLEIMSIAECELYLKQVLKGNLKIDTSEDILKPFNFKLAVENIKV